MELELCLCLHSLHPRVLICSKDASARLVKKGERSLHGASDSTCLRPVCAAVLPADYRSESRRLGQQLSQLQEHTRSAGAASARSIQAALAEALLAPEGRRNGLRDSLLGGLEESYVKAETLRGHLRGLMAQAYRCAPGPCGAEHLPDPWPFTCLVCSWGHGLDHK